MHLKNSPLTSENVLLCGSLLKVAPVVYGCVIYAGQDTKMMINSKFQSNRLSCVERRMNSYVFFLILIVITVSLIGLFGSLFYNDMYETHWYLEKFASSNKDLDNFLTFITYVNLIAIIPTSLYVSFELVKLIGSKFLEWDIEYFFYLLFKIFHKS